MEREGRKTKILSARKKKKKKKKKENFPFSPQIRIGHSPALALRDKKRTPTVRRRRRKRCKGPHLAPFDLPCRRDAAEADDNDDDDEEEEDEEEEEEDEGEAEEGAELGADDAVAAEEPALTGEPRSDRVHNHTPQ
jgi:hypothetical protein